MGDGGGLNSIDEYQWEILLARNNGLQGKFRSTRVRVGDGKPGPVQVAQDKHRLWRASSKPQGNRLPISR